MTLFEVSEKDIEGLTAEPFVDFMNHLLRAEAYRLEIPQQDVHTSLRITEPDGGIDARIEKGASAEGLWFPNIRSIWQFNIFQVTVEL